ncbi:hypothetical protein CAPTEDRAFT_223658 [Capitella teleta]|uniref:Uncharacterized protein n=1 Tax=Capitella teleta TaxID=283909 RepID=R7UZS7_CAPTE|nr:hypothetical protein CAPTEDRAFT_223658 [Capitella teleta]|eukprot:ELU09457.1 hypothetical protein CAPTEDRAFT_223658 [Capitella teleta]
MYQNRGANILCNHVNKCGWNSVCENGECVCVDGFKISHNGIDCIDGRCRDVNCVQCATHTRCKRCVDFIEMNTGRCLLSCETRFSLIIDGDQIGKVCDENSTTKALTYAACLVAVAAGILLSALFSAVCYFKFRTERERQLRFKLFGQVMEREAQIEDMNSDAQVASQSPNNAHEDGNLAKLRNLPPVNKVKYIHQITTLQPKQETLLEMLSKARLKAHTLPPDDDRCYIFINLASQLSRVVTILTEADAPCPRDGTFLLDWAHRLLRHYEERRHDPASALGDYPAASTSNLLHLKEERAKVEKSASFV